jgi:aldose 1-epimerase
LSAPLELRAGDASATLVPAIGGAIAAFSLAGVDALRPMPATAIAEGDVRRAAAYPLVPYSNRIRDARLTFGGQTHALERNFGDHPHAIHGVGWQRAWQVTRRDRHAAALVLRHDADGDAARAWPWPFTVSQAFELVARVGGATLAATMTIRNDGDAPFPFGLGWHPYFPRDADTTLAFAADGVWRNDATELPVAHVVVPPEWDFAQPRAVGGAPPLDNVFTGWAGHAALAGTRRGLATTLDADSACRCVVVYAPAGRDFVAVEPVTHETDAFNRAAAGAAGTGMRVLPPGAAFSCTMRINARAIRAAHASA